MGSKFKLGDIVWGKVKSHPWWPGKINCKDLAPSLVDAKTKGFVLVTFFGDSTYRWMDPMELILFEPHYLDKATQSRTRAFLMAVQEAIDELSKNAALGLTCRCRNPSNFSPANAYGLLKVDFDGYEEGATYSVDQIQRSREEFKPVEMLSFLQQLALRLTDTRRDGDSLKNLARILAYRKSIFQEKDDTYDEAFDSYDEAFDVMPISHGNIMVDANIGEGITLEISRSSNEDTTRELLGALKEGRSESMGSEFTFGNLVWGKVMSHPWWPGQIFDQALAPFSVKEAKVKGHLLVSFFGDNTYRWMDPMELIPFEPHYLDKANQSRSHAFLMAVQEAIDELSKRAALGLTCRCRNPSNFSPANAPGLLKVDINGYDEGATYSVDQVERSREELKPVEMLSFLHQLALTPIRICSNTDFLKNLSRVLAYRKAVYQEKDDTYDEAFDNYDQTFEMMLSGSVDSTVDVNDRGKALVQVPLSGQSPASKAEGKVLGKRVNFAKPIGGAKRSRTDNLCKGSEDSVMGLIIEEEPEEPGAILVMEFLPRAMMPSNSELKAMFAQFGPIDISDTYASWNSSTCQVLLKQKSDAQEAYDYVVRNESLFSKTNVSCYLQCSEVSSTFKKVQLLSSSSVDEANGSDGGGKFLLFAQDDYQENNSVKSQQTIPPSALPPRVPVYQKGLSQEASAQSTDAMNKTCSQNLASEMDNILTAATSDNQNITDISRPLLKLIEECEVQLLSSSSVYEANGSDGGGKFLLFAQDDYQEDNCVKSQQTIPPSALPPRVPVYQKGLSQEASAQSTDAMNTTCSQNLASEMENFLTAATSDSQSISDISRPLLKLIEECEECLYPLNLK